MDDKNLSMTKFNNDEETKKKIKEFQTKNSTKIENLFVYVIYSEAHLESDLEVGWETEDKGDKEYKEAEKKYSFKHILSCMFKNQRPNLKTLEKYTGKWHDIYNEIYEEIIEKFDILEQIEIRLKVTGNNIYGNICNDADYYGWVVIIREKIKIKKKKKIKVETNLEK